MRYSFYFCLFLAVSRDFIKARYLIQKKFDNDITSAMTQFCIGKERENFCSDEHLTMLINFAARQGKARPISNSIELEMERKKEIDRQNELKLEEEKRKQKRLKLKLEREKQHRLHLEKKKEQDLLKKRENEIKIMKLILKEINDSRKRLIFRF
jgi:hypothetical protein